MAKSAIMLLLACNIFETREPEPPAQQSANYVPPVLPDQVFMNMINSFRDLNSLNYVKSFADSMTSDRSFLFEPTSNAASTYPQLFASWIKQSEQRYFDNLGTLLQSNSLPSLVLNLTPLSIIGDSAQFEGTYQLTVPHTISGFTQTAVGRAQFYLKRDNFQHWVIWRWVDIANPQNDVSWSDFKGKFSPS